jgi:hypothetical protein
MEARLPQLILPIKLERSAEGLTGLGGLVVMEELARAVGLGEEVDGALEGPKSGRGYQPHEFVRGLIWMLHAGGRRLEDLRELRGEQKCWERWVCRRCPMRGRQEIGCGGKGGRGRKQSSRSVGSWWRPASR